MSPIWKFFSNTSRSFLTSVLSLMGIKLSHEKWCVWEQFIKFLLVGLSNTVIVLVVYYFIIFVFGSNQYLIGQTVGYFVGILNSFFWNSRYVFHNQTQVKKIAFIKMFFCYGITYIIQIGLLFLLVDIWHLSKVISPVISILVTTPINFLLNKLFAFA